MKKKQLSTSSRYSRQELLPQIGIKGQQKLAKRSIAIIGVGALGTTTANLLVRAGVGKIALFDRDVIELHNLQRQTFFTEKNVGFPKVAAAKEWLKTVNSSITINAFPIEINTETISLLQHYDLLLDCTDNMEVRFLLNNFCVKNKKTWIYCSAVEKRGQLFVITPESPCFSCLFSLPPAGSLETCDTSGVLSPATTAIAAMQVTETLKILTNQEPIKELLAYDAWNHSIQKVTVKKKKECVCCSKNQFIFLSGKKETTSAKLCGQGRFQIQGRKPDFSLVKNRLTTLGTTTLSSYGLFFEIRGKEISFFLFSDGRCLVKAKTQEEAKRIYGKYVGS